MPIPPLPYKAKCKKCGTSKIIIPTSDVRLGEWVERQCPKCKEFMSETKEPTSFDWFLFNMKNIFNKPK